VKTANLFSRFTTSYYLHLRLIRVCISLQTYFAVMQCLCVLFLRRNDKNYVTVKHVVERPSIGLEKERTQENENAEANKHQLGSFINDSRKTRARVGNSKQSSKFFSHATLRHSEEIHIILKFTCNFRF
jgi:hypothetical protein